MFAVIYHCYVKPGREADFEEAWEEMTHEFRDVHGGLGSCLHKTDEGEYLAYARWPDRERWAADKTIVNTEAMARMRDMLRKPTEAVPLSIERDLLVRS